MKFRTDYIIQLWNNDCNPLVKLCSPVGCEQQHEYEISLICNLISWDISKKKNHIISFENLILNFDIIFDTYVPPFIMTPLVFLTFIQFSSSIPIVSSMQENNTLICCHPWPYSLHPTFILASLALCSDFPSPPSLAPHSHLHFSSTFTSDSLSLFRPPPFFFFFLQ